MRNPRFTPKMPFVRKGLQSCHWRDLSGLRTIGGVGSVNRRFRTSAFSRPIDRTLLSRHQARQVTETPTTIPQKNQNMSSSMSECPVIRTPYRSASAATSFLVEKYANARIEIPRAIPIRKDRTTLKWRWIHRRNSSGITAPPIIFVSNRRRTIRPEGYDPSICPGSYRQTVITWFQEVEARVRQKVLGGVGPAVTFPLALTPLKGKRPIENGRSGRER